MMMDFAADMSPEVALHVGTGSLILCPVSGAVRKQMDVAVLPAATRMTLSRHVAAWSHRVSKYSCALRKAIGASYGRVENQTF